jgi:hypothetical protein
VLAGRFSPQSGELLVALVSLGAKELGSWGKKPLSSLRWVPDAFLKYHFWRLGKPSTSTLMADLDPDSR